MSEWVWLLVAGLVGGFFDAQVGGGGAITLPALLATGLPPHVALATNKFVATGASTMASGNYIRAGLIRHRFIWPLWALAGLGSVAGVFLVRRVAATHLHWLVVAAMVAITAWTLFRPDFGRDEKDRSHRRLVLAALAAAALVIGAYDGFLGPGTGSFLLFAFVGLAGFGFQAAAANARILNWGSNSFAFVAWAALGAIAWRTGAPMLAGTLAGGWLGSHITVRGGDRWVRPLFLVVTVGLLVRLLLQN